MSDNNQNNSTSPNDKEPDTAPAPETNWTKTILEMAPLIIFFAAYKMDGIMTATAAFMVAMTATAIANYVLWKKIPVMLWINFGFVSVLGGLTLYLQDETFVKLKPTIVYSLFATILLGGLLTGRHFLQMLLGSSLPELHQKGWTVLTRNWILFFVVMAITNEVVWRNFSSDTWVSFKAFGFLPITLVFAAFQFPLIMKYQVKPDADANES